MSDFNLEPFHTLLSGLMDNHNYFNLIRGNTSFKGQGSHIDFESTNRKYYSKNTASFETDLGDHHHSIYSMLKIMY